MHKTECYNTISGEYSKKSLQKLLASGIHNILKDICDQVGLIREIQAIGQY